MAMRERERERERRERERERSDERESERKQQSPMINDVEAKMVFYSREKGKNTKEHSISHRLNLHRN